MKQEDEKMLLNDICGRLPYGTMVYAQNSMDWYESEISTQVVSDLINEDYIIKPYLFPLSSMTKEQKREYHQSTSKDIDMLQDVILERLNGKDNTNKYAIAYNGIDWLNAHHFDYRGLIEKGLAIDATGLNIYKS